MAVNRKVIIDGQVDLKLNKASAKKVQDEANATINQGQDTAVRTQQYQAIKEMQQLQNLLDRLQNGEKVENSKKLGKDGLDAVSQLRAEVGSIKSANAHELDKLTSSLVQKAELLGTNASKAIYKELGKISDGMNLTLERIDFRSGSIKEAQTRLQNSMGDTTVWVRLRVDDSELRALQSETNQIKDEANRTVKQAAAQSKKAKDAQRTAETATETRKKEIVTEVVEREINKPKARQATPRPSRANRIQDEALSPGYELLSARERASLPADDRKQFYRNAMLAEGHANLGGEVLSRAELRKRTLSLVEQERKGQHPYTPAQQRMAVGGYDRGATSDPVAAQRQLDRWVRDAQASASPVEWPSNIAPASVPVKTEASYTPGEALKSRSQQPVVLGRTGERPIKKKTVSSDESKLAEAVRTGRTVRLDTVPKNSPLHPSNYGVDYVVDTTTGKPSSASRLNEAGERRAREVAASIALTGNEKALTDIKTFNDPVQTLYYRGQRREKFYETLADPTKLLQAVGNAAGEGNTKYYGEEVVRQLGLPTNYGDASYHQYPVTRGSKLEQAITEVSKQAKIPGLTRTEDGGFTLGGEKSKNGRFHDHALQTLFGYYSGFHPQFQGEEYTPSNLMKMMFGGEYTTGYDASTGESLRNFTPGGLSSRDVVPYLSNADKHMATSVARAHNFPALERSMHRADEAGLYSRSQKELQEHELLRSQEFKRQKALADYTNFHLDNQHNPNLRHVIRNYQGLDDLIGTQWNNNVDGKHTYADWGPEQSRSYLKTLETEAEPLRTRNGGKIDFHSLPTSYSRQGEKLFENLDASSTTRAREYLAHQEFARTGRVGNAAREYWAGKLASEPIENLKRQSLKLPDIADTMPLPLRGPLDQIGEMLDTLGHQVKSTLTTPNAPAHERQVKHAQRQEILNSSIPGMVRGYRQYLEGNLIEKPDLIGEEVHYDPEGNPIIPGMTSAEFIERNYGFGRTAHVTAKAFGFDDAGVRHNFASKIFSSRIGQRVRELLPEYQSALKNPGQNPDVDATIQKIKSRMQTSALPRSAELNEQIDRETARAQQDILAGKNDKSGLRHLVAYSSVESEESREPGQKQNWQQENHYTKNWGQRANAEAITDGAQRRLVRNGMASPDVIGATWFARQAGAARITASNSYKWIPENPNHDTGWNGYNKFPKSETKRPAAITPEIEPTEYRGSYDLVPVNAINTIPELPAERRKRVSRLTRGRTLAKSRNSPFRNGRILEYSAPEPVEVELPEAPANTAPVRNADLLSAAMRASDNRHSPISTGSHSLTDIMSGKVKFGPQLVRNQATDAEINKQIETLSRIVQQTADKVVPKNRQIKITDHPDFQYGNTEMVVQSNPTPASPSPTPASPEPTPRNRWPVQERLRANGRQGPRELWPVQARNNAQDSAIREHEQEAARIQAQLEQQDLIDRQRYLYEKSNKPHLQEREKPKPNLYTPENGLIHSNPWVDSVAYSGRTGPAWKFAADEYNKRFNDQNSHDAQRVNVMGEKLREDLNLTDYFNAKANGWSTSASQSRRADADLRTYSREAALEKVAGLFGLQETGTLRTANASGMSRAGAFEAIAGTDISKAVHKYSEDSLKEIATAAQAMVDTPKEAGRIMREARQRIQALATWEDVNTEDHAGLAGDRARQQRANAGLNMSAAEQARYQNQQGAYNRTDIDREVARRMRLDYGAYTDATTHGRSIQSITETVSGLNSKKLLNLEPETFGRIAEASQKAHEALKQFGAGSTEFATAMQHAKETSSDAVVDDRALKGATTEQQDRARRYKQQVQSLIYETDREGRFKRDDNGERIESAWARRTRRELAEKRPELDSVGQSVVLQQRAADAVNTRNERVQMLKAGLVNMGAFMGGTMLQGAFTQIGTQISDSMQAQRAIQRIYEVQNKPVGLMGNIRNDEDTRTRTAATWRIVGQHADVLGASRLEVAEVTSKLSDGGRHSVKEVSDNLNALDRAARNSGSALKDMVSLMAGMEALNFTSNQSAEFMGKYMGNNRLSAEDMTRAVQLAGTNEGVGLMSLKDRERLLVGIAQDKEFKGFSSNTYVAIRQAEELKASADMREAPQRKSNTANAIEDLANPKKLMEKVGGATQELLNAVSPVIAALTGVVSVLLLIVTTSLQAFNGLSWMKNMIGVVVGLTAAMVALGNAINYVSLAGARGGLATMFVGAKEGFTRLILMVESLGKAMQALSVAGLVSSLRGIPSLIPRLVTGARVATAGVSAAVTAGTVGGVAIAPLLLGLLPVLLAGGFLAYIGKKIKDDRALDDKTNAQMTRFDIEDIAKDAIIPSYSDDKRSSLEIGPEGHKKRWLMTDKDQAEVIARGLLGDNEHSFAILGETKDTLKEQIEKIRKGNDPQLNGFVDNVEAQRKRIAATREAIEAGKEAGTMAADKYRADAIKSREGSPLATWDILNGSNHAPTDEQIEVGAAKANLAAFEKTTKMDWANAGYANDVPSPEYAKYLKEKKTLTDQVVAAETKEIESKAQLAKSEAMLRDNKVQQTQAQIKANQEAQNGFRELIAESQGRHDGMDTNLVAAQQRLNELIAERKQLMEQELQLRLEQIQATQQHIVLVQRLNAESKVGTINLAGEESGRTAKVGTNAPAGDLFNSVLTDLANTANRGGTGREIKMSQDDRRRLQELKPQVDAIDSRKQKQVQDIENLKLAQQRGHLTPEQLETRTRTVNAQAALDISKLQQDLAKKLVGPAFNNTKLVGGMFKQILDPAFAGSTGTRAQIDAAKGANADRSQQAQTKARTESLQRTQRNEYQAAYEADGSATRFAARDTHIRGTANRELERLKAELQATKDRVAIELKRPELTAPERRNLLAQRQDAETTYTTGVNKTLKTARDDTFSNQVDNWLNNAKMVKRDQGKETPETLRQRLAILNNAIKTAETKIDPRFGTTLKEGSVQEYERLIQERQMYQQDYEGKLRSRKRVAPDFERQLTSLYGDVTGTVGKSENRAISLADAIRDNDVLTEADKLKLGLDKNGNVIKGSRLDKTTRLANTQNTISQAGKQYEQDLRIAETDAVGNSSKLDREGFARRAKEEYNKASKLFDTQRSAFPDMASFERAKKAALDGLLQNVKKSEQAVKDWEREISSLRRSIQASTTGLMGGNFSNKVEGARQEYENTRSKVGDQDPLTLKAAQNVKDYQRLDDYTNAAESMSTRFSAEDAQNMENRSNIDYAARVKQTKAEYDRQQTLFDQENAGRTDLTPAEYQARKANYTKTAKVNYESAQKGQDEFDKMVRDLQASADKLGEEFGNEFGSHDLTNKVDDAIRGLKSSKLGKDSPLYQNLMAQLEEYKGVAAMLDEAANDFKPIRLAFDNDRARNVNSSYKIDYAQHLSVAKAAYSAAESELLNSEKYQKADPARRLQLEAQVLGPKAQLIQDAQSGLTEQDNIKYNIDEMVRKASETLGVSGDKRGSREDMLTQNLRELDQMVDAGKIDIGDERFRTLREMMPQAQALDAADKTLSNSQLDTDRLGINSAGAHFDSTANSLNEYITAITKAGDKSEDTANKIKGMTTELLKQKGAAQDNVRKFDADIRNQQNTNANVQYGLNLGVGLNDNQKAWIANQEQAVQTQINAKANLTETEDIRKKEFMAQNFDPDAMIAFYNRYEKDGKTAEVIRQATTVDANGIRSFTQGNDQIRQWAQGNMWNVKNAYDNQTADQNVELAKQSFGNGLIERMAEATPDHKLANLTGALFDYESKNSVNDIIDATINGNKSLISRANSDAYRHILNTTPGRKAYDDLSAYNAGLEQIKSGPQHDAIESIRNERGTIAHLTAQRNRLTGEDEFSNQARQDIDNQIAGANSRISAAADVLKDLLPQSVIDELKNGTIAAGESAKKWARETLNKQMAVSQANETEAKSSYSRTARHSGDPQALSAMYDTLRAEKNKQFEITVKQGKDVETKGVLAEYGAVTGAKTLEELRTYSNAHTDNVDLKAKLDNIDNLPTVLEAASMNIDELSRRVNGDMLNAIINVRESIKNLVDEEADARMSLAGLMGDSSRGLRDALQGSFQDRLNDSLANRDWAGAGRNAALMVGDKQQALTERYNAYHKSNYNADEVMQRGANDVMFVSGVTDILNTRRDLQKQIKTASWSAAYDDTVEHFDRETARKRPKISEQAADEYDLRQLQKRLAYFKGQDTSGLDTSAIQKVNSDIRDTTRQIEQVTNKMQDHWKNFWTGLAQDMMGALKDGLAKSISKALDQIFKIEDERTKKFRQDMNNSQEHETGYLNEAENAQANADRYQKMADSAKTPEERKMWLDMVAAALQAKDQAMNKVGGEQTNRTILENNKKFEDDDEKTSIWSQAVETMKNSFVQRITGDMLDQSVGKLLDNLLNKATGTEDPEVVAKTQLAEATTTFSQNVLDSQTAIKDGLVSAGELYQTSANTFSQAVASFAAAATSVGTVGSGSFGVSYNPAGLNVSTAGPSSGNFGVNYNNTVTPGYSQNSATPFGSHYTPPTAPGLLSSSGFGTHYSATPTAGTPNSVASSQTPSKASTGSFGPLVTSPVGQQLVGVGTGLLNNAIQINTGNELADYGLGYAKTALIGAAGAAITGGAAAFTGALSTAFGPVGLAVAAVGAGIMLMKKDMEIQKASQAWMKDHQYGAVKSNGVYDYGLDSDKGRKRWLQVGGSTDRIDVKQVNVSVSDPMSTPAAQLEIGRQIARQSKIASIQKGVN